MSSSPPRTDLEVQEDHDQEHDQAPFTPLQPTRTNVRTALFITPARTEGVTQVETSLNGQDATVLPNTSGQEASTTPLSDLLPSHPITSLSAQNVSSSLAFMQTPSFFHGSAPFPASTYSLLVGPQTSYGMWPRSYQFSPYFTSPLTVVLVFRTTTLPTVEVFAQTASFLPGAINTLSSILNPSSIATSGLTPAPSVQRAAYMMLTGAGRSAIVLGSEGQHGTPNATMTLYSSVMPVYTIAEGLPAGNNPQLYPVLQITLQTAQAPMPGFPFSQTPPMFQQTPSMFQQTSPMFRAQSYFSHPDAIIQQLRMMQQQNEQRMRQLSEQLAAQQAQ